MRIRNVLILSVSQAIGLSGISAVALLGGLIGSDIAPNPAWATLPNSIAVVGVALSSVPAAMLMKRIGRRAGFTAAAALASLAGLLAAIAVARGNFPLFCVGTLLIGVNGAFMQQYRFAATESVDRNFTSRAVSLVLVGGIAAGFLGPELAQQARDWLPAGLYVGSFASVAVLYAIAALLLSFLSDVRATGPIQEAAALDEGKTGNERPLRELIGQPVFVVAMLSAAVAYGVMTLLMTATPIQLHLLQGFSMQATTLVIQSHIVAMFLPSLFTGLLLERLGVLRVLLAGVLCLLGSVAAALLSVQLPGYWTALVLLGVGWNFLFVGGTVLLTRAYRPSERFKAQAVNDLVVFTTQASASLSAGALLYAADWRVVSLAALLPLVLVLGAVLALRQQIAAPAPASV
jgi:MFS family permease